MKKHAFTISSVAAVLAAIPGAASAQVTTAQPTADASEAPNDTIVVTARRRAEDINRVPVAVSAFSSEQLVAKGIENTRDLTKITPGLNFVASSSIINPIIGIRGYSRALSGPGTPGVITYFNEVALPNTGAILPTFDVSNIQVLKGPQGTLFGRNAVGGAILTYSQQPTDEFEGYGSLEYGRFNSIKVEGAVNVPIVGDKVAIRVAGLSRRSDGYTKSDFYSPAQFVPTATPGRYTPVPGRFLRTGQADSMKDNAIRVSLLLKPTDDITNLTVADYDKLEADNASVFEGNHPGGRAFISFLTGLPLGLASILDCGNNDPSCDIDAAIVAQQARGPRHIATGVPNGTNVRSRGITNTTTIDLTGNVTLKNIFGYREVKQETLVDIDGTPLPFVDIASNSDLRQVSNELQVSGQLFEDRLKFIAGGLYLKSEPNSSDGFQTLSGNVLGGISSSVSTNFLTETSKALFGQIDYDFSDLLQGLSLSAGYRYSWDKQSGCTYDANYAVTAGGRPLQSGSKGYSPTPGACADDSVLTDPAAIAASFGNGAVSQKTGHFGAKSSQGTYTLAVNWQANDDLLLYVTRRKGYRAGGFNSPALDPAISDVQTFKPEVVTDWEAGLKSRFNFGSVRGAFDIAAYSLKGKGNQFYQNTNGVTGAPGGGILLNKADISIKGFEANLTVNPLPGLTLGGNAAYIDYKVDRLTIPQSVKDFWAANGNAGAQAGLLSIPTLVNSPKWQANANAEYRATGLVGGADLVLSGDFHYQDAYRQNDLVVPGYNTTDARIALEGLKDGRLDGAFFVRNVFDRTYRAAASSSAAGTTVKSYIYAAPRTWGVSLRYRFGN